MYTVTANITLDAKTSSDASSKIESLLAVLLNDEKIYDFLVKAVRPEPKEPK